VSKLWRVVRIGIILSFYGCITPPKVSDTEPPKITVVEKKPIRIFPGIKIPIQRQIQLGEMLQRLPPKEIEKIFLKLDSGMYKTDKQMELEGLVYPKDYSKIKGYL